ncbi:unnamed protein product [Arabidopsis thaliana]|uniref:(thale cress) hypothetical protein n=1 Tax=Arabidopsis thaliana TaxID=3702 RepID=A0A7G2F131_ARATH|nr:unnamed protein product [Arabidopsis thaliana]
MVGLASTKSIRPPPSRYHDDFIEEGSLGRGGYGKVVQCVFKMDQKVYAVKGILMTSVDPLLMPSTAEILTEFDRFWKMTLGLLFGIGRTFRRKRASSLDILSPKRAPKDFYKGKNCKPPGFHTRKGFIFQSNLFSSTLI